jgi:copper resistance protein B
MRHAGTILLAASVSFGSHIVGASPDSHDGMHEPMLFWGAGAEIGASEKSWLSDDTGELVTWDSFAWIGDVDHSELKAMLSWSLDEFWDLQTGMRFDLQENGRTWAAIGVHGMAPYFVETHAHVFVDREGNVAFHGEYEVDFAITQEVFVQPRVGVEAYLQDMPELDVGAGLASIELGVQLRYEFTRKFAPYVEIVYERALGETSIIEQANGEDTESTTVRVGLRFRL